MAMPRLSERIRAFLAIHLPPDVRAALRALQAELRRAGLDLRWVDPEAMHLTLLFLGETPLECIADLSLALRGCETLGESFAVELAGLGAFPNLARARVLWVGVRDTSGALLRLHETLVELAHDAGCRYDRQRFSPHLTLGRPRERGGRALRLPADLAAVELGILPVDRVALIRSELLPAGPLYTDLCTAELG